MIFPLTLYHVFASNVVVEVMFVHVPGLSPFPHDCVTLKLLTPFLVDFTKYCGVAIFAFEYVIYNISLVKYPFTGVLGFFS